MAVKKAYRKHTLMLVISLEELLKLSWVIRVILDHSARLNFIPLNLLVRKDWNENIRKTHSNNNNIIITPIGYHLSSV